MSSDRKAPRHFTAWLIPAATFVAGAVCALALTGKPAPTDVAPAPPTFGAAPATPAATEAAPTNSAAAAELALYRQINDRFVEQLRQYETRLRAIATTAGEEGAPDSATALRDFALETELLIDRYDLILKKK